MKKGLGKGLDIFFSDSPSVELDKKEGVIEVKITEIEPNKKQPRKTFDKEKIAALSESIKEHGIIQPIVVTKNENGMYSIVAGERRWRAAKEAKLRTVPVIIKEYSKEQSAEIALIENLQREDLNAIEEALGYRALMDEFGMTQEEVSQKIGKSRSAVANSLRLLALDDVTKELLSEGLISGGHARALLAVENSVIRGELAKRIADEGLSVRDAEALAKKASAEKPKSRPKKKSDFQIELDSIGEKLSDKFGTKVKISSGSRKGKIEIEYYGNDDLDRILSLIGK